MVSRTSPTIQFVIDPWYRFPKCVILKFFDGVLFSISRFRIDGVFRDVRVVFAFVVKFRCFRSYLGLSEVEDFLVGLSVLD